MRAVQIETLDGPDAARLIDMAEPDGAHRRAGGRRLLIDVHAVGLSFIDALQSRGGYQNGIPAPYICGSEPAGVVLEAPPGSGFAVGDRVAGVTWYGGAADQALLVPEYVITLPAGMSYVEGAAVYMNYSTAWYAYDRARVRPGEVVLVHGAAGGVGTAAIDLAESFGACIFAVVSSDAKAEAATGLGAHQIVRSDGDWLQQVRDLTGGRGVDVVIDPVGGDMFTDSLRSLVIGGRLVVVGFAGGSIPTVKVNRLLHRNLTITGITMDNMDLAQPGTLLRVRDGVQSLLDAGRLHPLVGAVFPLERTAQALASMENRTAVGKVVVEVKPG